MTYLLPLGLLTLFTALKVKLGVVVLRPFDAVVVLMILSVFLAAPAVRHKRLAGLLALLPFFVWHVFSAFLFDVENGLREGLQIVLMIGFAITLMLSVDRIDYRTAGKVMIAGLIFVLAYTIIWHISQGSWVGWKRLNNPKAVFGYLPMALGCILLFAAPAQRRLYWLVWIGLLVIIILSTERKALLIYGILTAMFLARGRILAAVPFVGAGVIGLVLLVNLFAAQDFTRQLRTLINPIESGGSAAMVARGVTPESLSNAQRTFSFEVASGYFKQAPLIGIGTNAYSYNVLRQYPYLPPYMLLGIHGEFLRVATENGLIGLVFYIAIWLASLIRLRRGLRYFWRTDQITRAQATIAPFVLLTAPFMYLAFDASGTPSFAVLVIVAFMPELTFGALRQRTARAPAPAEARQGGSQRFGVDQLAVG